MSTNTITSGARQLPPATAERLAELFDEELRFSPGAHGGFVNHVAMGLVAAARLGAGPDELRASYDEQVASGYLRERGEPSWLAPEATAVAQVGVAEAVRARAAELVDAPAARWFHAAIRLEHAVDAEHPGQVANALHDWAEHAEPLGDRPELMGTRTYAEVVRAMIAATPVGGSGSDLTDVAGQPWSRAELAELRPGPDLLDEVAAVALAAHVAAGSIGSLHLVTGTRAARALNPLLDPADAEVLAVRTAQAVAAGVVVTVPGALPDAASRDARRAQVVCSWDEVAAAALATRDPHVVKLAWAAHQEQTATGDPLYRWVAARDAGLISDDDLAPAVGAA